MTQQRIGLVALSELYFRNFCAERTACEHCPVRIQVTLRQLDVFTLFWLSGTKRMEYEGKSYHEKCFCCDTCGNAIGKKSFVKRSDGIFCQDCFESRLASKCKRCKKVRVHLLLHMRLYIIKSQHCCGNVSAKTLLNLHICCASKKQWDSVEKETLHCLRGRPHTTSTYMNWPPRSSSTVRFNALRERVFELPGKPTRCCNVLRFSSLFNWWKQTLLLTNECLGAVTRQRVIGGRLALSEADAIETSHKLVLRNKGCASTHQQ